VRFLLLKILTEWVINCYILCHFSIPNHVYYHCRSRSRRRRIRSRIALRLRLRPNDAAPAPQHWLQLKALAQQKLPAPLINQRDWNIKCSIFCFKSEDTAIRITKRYPENFKIYSAIRFRMQECSKLK
jgi:hypothetical protein